MTAQYAFTLNVSEKKRRVSAETQSELTSLYLWSEGSASKFHYNASRFLNFEELISTESKTIESCTDKESI